MKNWVKKWITTLSIGALFLPLLSGCASNQKNTQQQPSYQQKSTKKTSKNGCPNPSGPAEFTSEELKDGPGWIQYGPLDSLGRATAANALITKSMIGTGTKANPDIRPTGFQSGKKGHARGHLIGRQLGGSGDTMKNLVTLYQNPVNTPYMTKYENEVRDVVEQGNKVRYRVTPIYGKGQLMPVSIKMEAKTLNNNRLNYTVVIPNKK